MQLSLRVICNRNIVETINQRVAELTNYLSLAGDYAFLPYWKDEDCVVLNTHYSGKVKNQEKSKKNIPKSGEMALGRIFSPNLLHQNRISHKQENEITHHSPAF